MSEWQQLDIDLQKRIDEISEKYNVSVIQIHDSYIIKSNGPSRESTCLPASEELADAFEEYYKGVISLTKGGQ